MLSALNKEALREIDEGARVGSERRWAVWRMAGDADHGADDAGARPETFGRKFGDVPGAAGGGDQNRKRAIVFGVRLGEHAIGNFVLDGDEETFAARVVGKKDEHGGGRRGVGKVGDHREGAVGRIGKRGCFKRIERGEHVWIESVFACEAITLDEGEA